MNYTLYQPRIAEARKYPAIWRLALGVLTILLMATIWVISLGFLGYFFLGDKLFDIADAASMGKSVGPIGTLGLLTSILGLGLGSLIAARLWHKRRVGSIIGPGSRTIRHFAIGMIITWAVAAIFYVPFLPFSEPLLPNMELTLWVMWLPIALFVVLLQTGSEEILFRGYLQSQLAGRFQSAFVWMLLPAMVFAAAHYSPDLPSQAAAAYIVATLLFGLIAGDVTARTGNIGAAWGIHFANNVMAILILSADETLSGLAAYRLPTSFKELSLTSPLIILDLAVMFLTYVVIRRIIGR